MSVNEFWKKTFANMSLQEKVSLLLELHMEEVITYVSGQKDKDRDRDRDRNSNSEYKRYNNNYNNGPYQQKEQERKPKWVPKEQASDKHMDKQVDKTVDIIPPKKDDQIIS